MTGGQITANEAAGGGGVATEHADGGVFIMTDGIIAGNVARMNEGGGVAITYGGKGNIIGGYITNNACETEEHWGGGGLFISDNAVCTMRSVLVTNNHAEGFGAAAPAARPAESILTAPARFRSETTPSPCSITRRPASSKVSPATAPPSPKTIATPRSTKCSTVRASTIRITSVR